MTSRPMETIAGKALHMKLMEFQRGSVPFFARKTAIPKSDNRFAIATRVPTTLRLIWMIPSMMIISKRMNSSVISGEKPIENIHDFTKQYNIYIIMGYDSKSKQFLILFIQANSKSNLHLHNIHIYVCICMCVCI